MIGSKQTIIRNTGGGGSTNDKGYFANPTALTTAYPTGSDGWYAIVGSTDTVWIWDSGTTAWVNSGVAGTSDHGALTGLADDDHTQYLTQARGDARYYTETETDTLLSGKANTSHTQNLSTISDVTMTVANLNSLDDGVNSTLHFHNTDRDRANHTGTQAISTVTGLQTALDNKLDDSQSSAFGLTLLDDADASTARTTLGLGTLATQSGTFSGASSGTNTGDNAVNSLYSGLVTNQTHTGDVTGATTLTLATVNSNVGSFGLAGSVAQFVVNAKGLITSAVNVAISIASTAISDFASASRAETEAELVAGTNITITPSGTGATRQLTIASTGGGGGSPGGSDTQVQFNNAGAFAGSPNVKIHGDDLMLALEPTPTVPTADHVKIFARKVGGRMMQAVMGPSGLDTTLQPHLGRNKIRWSTPQGNGTVISTNGLTLTATGTATSASVAVTNIHTMMARLDYLVTTASTTAVAGFRYAAAQFAIGHASNALLGGFHMICRWGPATGVSTATNRAFVGMRSLTTAPTDVEPSSFTNIVGMGWDAADTNIQIMHRGTGAVTKIDLGASFPVPTTDRTEVYEIALFSPPGTTQSVGYEVQRLSTGAKAEGVITTNLPATTVLLAPQGYMSVGGTSSVIGISLMGMIIETDY